MASLNKNGDISQQQSGRKVLSKDAKTYAQLQHAFCGYIELLVDDCYDKLHIDFDSPLQENRVEIDKAHYTKLVEYLKVEINELKIAFIDGLADLFEQFWKQQGAAEKSVDSMLTSMPVEVETLEEEYAMQMFICHCELQFADELHELDRQFARLLAKDEIASNEIPVSPEKLVRLMGDTVGRFDLKLNSRISLYQAVEENVISLIGLIYSELIRICHEQQSSHIKESAETADQRKDAELMERSDLKQENAAADKTINEDFKRLQEKLDIWRAKQPSSPFGIMPGDAFSSFDVFGVKQAIAMIGSSRMATVSSQDTAFRPIKWEVLEKLQEPEIEEGVRGLSREHEDVLDLVALIFKRIADDEKIPEAIAKILFSLELSVSQSVLDNKAFFVQPEHPIRRYVDEIYKAALFLNMNDYFDRSIVEHIEQAVITINNSSSNQTEIYQKAHEDFSVFLNKKNQFSEILSDRLKQLFQNKENLQLAKIEISNTINNCLQATDLPSLVTTFLNDVWRNVLLYAYLKKQHEPAFWNSSLQTMNDLIASVSPPDSEADRVVKLAVLPGMIKALREGLDRISHGNEDQALFFKQLTTYHANLLKKDTVFPKTQVSDDSSAEITESGDKKNPVREDGGVKIANQLTPGTWLVFKGTDKPQWGQLIWKSAVTGNMLFAGRSGAKVMALHVDQLAEEIRLQRAEIVEYVQTGISKRVLATILGN